MSPTGPGREPRAAGGATATGLLAEMEALAATMSTKPPRLRRRVVVLDDGHRVGVSTCGEGVPLVMVHGIVAEGMLYARTLRRLAGMGFRVVAIDSAGHGRTRSLGAAGWSWQAYVRLHERVIDELGIRRAVLAGHSMGGRIVVDLASRQPERALGLLPIDAAIGAPFDTLARAATFLPPAVPLAVGLLALDTARTAVRANRQVGSLTRLAAPSLGDRLRSLPALVPAFGALLRAGSSTAMLARVADADVPLAVVHGAWDLVTPYVTGRAAALAGSGQLVRLEGGGHSWLLEDADALPAIVEALLTGPFGRRLRTETSIAELYEPNALALRLDQPTSRPYELEPRHAWRVETA
jgi:pimeloyl-ACP methyl ester carboxylesterase